MKESLPGVPKTPLGVFLEPPRGIPKTPEALKAEALPKVAASRALGETKEQREERRKIEREEEDRVQREWEFMTQEQKHEVIRKKMRPNHILGKIYE